MKFKDLHFLRMFTGISLGRECYLNESRVKEFRDGINDCIPNFFTRYDFQQIPNSILLASPNEESECVITLNNITYTSFANLASDVFLNRAQTILKQFMTIFALEDIRRIGKVYDFVWPLDEQRLLEKSPKQFLSRLIKIEEPVQVNNLHLLFQREGKNINIQLQPIQGPRIRARDIEREFESPSGIVIRCDVNNIQTEQSLEDIPKTLEEIFGFIDGYIQSDLIDFLNKYLEVEYEQ